MADQDKDQYNDEYHFADLEGISPVGDDEATTEVTHTETVTERRFSEPNYIRRNALIVIGIVLLALILYKFLGSYFSERKLAVKETTPVPVQPNLPQSQLPPEAPPESPIVQQPVVQESTQINQKISSLEVGQQSMRSEVETMSAQLGGINTNINNLTAQIAQLNQIINTLNAKVGVQAREIEQLTIIKRPKPVKKVVRKIIRSPKYYIQAVIPGRAWLIASNGSTLTVREGSELPGYGTVKLIDPNQGRIITSSGQMIRFSQADS